MHITFVSSKKYDVGNIVPIYKKKGSTTSSKIFRPIALANVVSKIFENCLMQKCNKYLNSGYWQFGYKPNLGTETAVFALKSVIHHYRHNNSSVFGCFLDASKAFDNVLHSKLARKLIVNMRRITSNLELEIK